MATVTKTKSATWKALVRRSGWPTIIKTFRVKRDAENWARTTEDEIVRGIYVPRSSAEKMTVKHAIERYLSEITPTKKKTTQRAEGYRAKQLSDSLGKYSLASLNTDIIGKYRDSRLEMGKSNSTVRLELALLGHLYATAIKEWHIGLSVNPVLNVRKPSAGEGRNRRLINDEEVRLLEACDSHSNQFLGWIVRLALYTAMRKNEIVTLTRNQINFTNQTLFLPDTKNKSVRTVPLTDKAVAILQKAINHPIRPINTELIFFGEPGRDGKRKPYIISKVWSQALERADITDLKFHDLRHEATSRFVESGLSDQEVASITGHKSMQMLKRYTHLRSEDLVRKISKI